MEKAQVLIVDDEPINIKVLMSIFLDVYEIRVAKSGEEALQRIEEQAPDLILLDIVMPGMDGFEVFTQIRRDSKYRNIPVMFVTSKRSPEEEAAGLELGAADYITKPYTPGVVLQRVANQIAAKRNVDKLEQLSVTDGLTAIANRRRFDEYISEQVEVARRAKTDIALIMIDVDFFKVYNDLYGHAKGDECLKIIASTLARNLDRTVDMAARYGGEEFAVILPATGSAGATECAYKLSQALAEIDIKHEKSEVSSRVTLSMGIAAISPFNNSLNCLDLVRMADEALYEAKRTGRNRYLTFDEILK